MTDEQTCVTDKQTFVTDKQTFFPLVKKFLPCLFSFNLSQNSLKTSAWTQAFNTYPCHKYQARTVELDRVRTNRQTNKQPYANFNIDSPMNHRVQNWPKWQEKMNKQTAPKL